MAHAYPYSFQFTNWEGEDQTVCILVYFERTRSKSYVFRTKTNWDAEKITQFDIKDDSPQVQAMDPNDLFWASMRLAAVCGLLEHDQLEESIDALEDKAGFEYVADLKREQGGMQMEQILAKLPPKLNVRVFDNGWY